MSVDMAGSATKAPLACRAGLESDRAACDTMRFVGALRRTFEGEGGTPVPMNRWVKTALVVLIGLVAVGLRWPFGGDSSGPQTYANDAYGFTLTYDGALTELPLGEAQTDETQMAPDFETGFFDADGPAVDDDYAADGVTVAVFEIGDAVPAGDARLQNLDDMVLSSLDASGNTELGEVRAVEMHGCSAAVAVESVDAFGRRSLDCLGVAGSRLYWVAAYATSGTADEIWPLLAEAVDSFAVTRASAEAPAPKTYTEPGKTFSIACDRRFIRMPVDAQQQEGFSQPLGLSDPLSGVDAQGVYRDGIIVSVQEIGGTLTSAERSTFLTDMAAGLNEDGWRLLAGPETLPVDGSSGYRFEANAPDGLREAIYVVLSGATAYYIECFAQKATWKQLEPLFDEAARSFDVL